MNQYMTASKDFEMSGQVTSLKVVFRKWERGSGLAETEHTLSSLQELYDICLKTHDPDVIDRVIIEGTGTDGSPHRVTLAFQSSTGPE